MTIDTVPANPVMDMSEAVKDELAGRMYECVDIRRAIESGEFTTIEDVLSFVIESAGKLESVLRGEGVFDGLRILTREEFEAKARDVEQYLRLAEFDPSGAIPQ
ncbi:hypothetical protein [Burkholderia cepacia]|uniref:hypothetical protein n=1 Tax=Burkholderia cepacia TaxID=292 RepID=UPI0026E061DB|nr:hypothetical protein [Burkholderia cepacia]MDO5948068.1 hypothetical protein [Burkholderia cepacia]